MKLEEFVSGEYKNGIGYRAFFPNKINNNWGWNDTKLDALLAEASRQIGELNAYSWLLPNVDLYIKMHIRIEAHKSSRIKGTKTTIEEELLQEEEISPKKSEDWEAVQNYIKATEYAIERINDTSYLNGNLLKEMHELLLTDLKNESNSLGQFRKTQTWVGGSMPSTASYIPPLAEDLIYCFNDLDFFINNDDIDTPDLIKIAIIHYQFEVIHPFLNGNGRIGRMLIPLYLRSKGVLDKPCLYLSAFFEKNKDLYYAKLDKARTENDLIGWIKFFLEGIIETSEIAKDKLLCVAQLTRKIDRLILQIASSSEKAKSIDIYFYKKVIEYFYNEPISSLRKLRKSLRIPGSTLSMVLAHLQKERIIVESSDYTKEDVFVFSEYLNIFLS